MSSIKTSLAVLFVLSSSTSFASEIKVPKVSADLTKSVVDESIWKNAKEEAISLTAQPMTLPRPKTTTTQVVRVQAVHNGQWITFRMKWRSDEKAEAGKLGQFSDAVALQFPVKEGPPPPVFMGAKDHPVHIFHWRAQYQRDQEKGKPTMSDLYPNMNPDMYPMEFKDPGHVQGLTEEKQEVYSAGKAAGNPQSYQKPSSVDEIVAEGFGTSSILQNRMATGQGTWKNGEWSVVISRPLKLENGSSIQPGKEAYVAFAVWQGAKQEVGSRKCVTMNWIPLQVSAQ